MWFRTIAKEIPARGRVESITVRLVVDDAEGEVWFTDLMLQGGSSASGWIGHVTELPWTTDG